MSGILLLLGSNLGERSENLTVALNELIMEKVHLIERSSVYESQPWGISEQPWFLNLVIEVETSLSPSALLRTCLGIEQKMGRVRKEKWGERLIDIDILYYGNQVINEDELVVPHPGISDRRFTLMPLAEKWPNLIHPVLDKTQKEMLIDASDPLIVKKTDVVLSQ